MARLYKTGVTIEVSDRDVARYIRAGYKVVEPAPPLKKSGGKPRKDVEEQAKKEGE